MRFNGSLFARAVVEQAIVVAAIEFNPAGGVVPPRDTNKSYFRDFTS